MPSNLPQFTIRIPLNLWRKIRYIAESNARSANREIESLIKNHIADFECENGEIHLDE